MEKQIALELKNVSKRFGKVVANNNVNLTVYRNEILSLLGENGSGKTTLMNMLSGIYFPDEGKIFINGEEAVIASPKDAYGYKIGMIHQHFKLVDVFSAAENIVLGNDNGEKYDIKTVNAKVEEIADRYGFEIDPEKDFLKREEIIFTAKEIKDKIRKISEDYGFILTRENLLFNGNLDIESTNKKIREIIIEHGFEVNEIDLFSNEDRSFTRKEIKAKLKKFIDRKMIKISDKEVFSLVGKEFTIKAVDAKIAEIAQKYNFEICDKDYITSEDIFFNRNQLKKKIRQLSEKYNIILQKDDYFIKDKGKINIEIAKSKICSVADFYGVKIQKEDVLQREDKLFNKKEVVDKIKKVLDVYAHQITNKEVDSIIGGKYDIKTVNAKVKEIADRYGFEIDPEKKIHEMSVSEKQTVEIIKVLYRGADILILDEPTAVLTPQEIAKLFKVLKEMRKDGKSIIIITHKLNEVMEISDRVAILRKGEYIGTVETSETNEKQLTEMMVGKKIDLKIERIKTDFDRPLLELRDLQISKDDGSKAIDDVSFYIRGGEILGIAGVAGCGQKELCEAIAGLRKIENGSIMHKGESIVGLPPKEIINKGIAMSFIPEDRLGMGLAPSFSITDNMILKTYAEAKGPFVDRKSAREKAQKLIERLEIVTPSTETPVRRLSGGNVQKVLVGREIEAGPNVIVTAYPVRGLDINSSYAIYDILNEQKKNGVGVLFVGEDLDILLALCDKIMVLCHGKNMGVVHAEKTTKEELGLMMTGSLDLSVAKEKEYGKAKDSNLTDEEWLAQKTIAEEGENNG